MKNLMKFICFVVSISVILSMAACSGNKSVSPTSAESQTEKTATQAASEEKTTGPVKIKAMVYNTDSARKEILEKYYYPNMEKELPGIDVEFLIANNDKLKLLNSTGELPDVFFSSPELKSFVKSNSFVDLTPYIEKDGFKSKYTNPAAIAPYRDGKIYTISAGSDQYFVPWIFYHKSIFEENKIEIPKNYDEFLNVVKTLKDKGYIPLTGDGWIAQIVLYQQLMMAENPKFVQDLVAGKASIKDKTSMDAITRVIELAKMGAFPKDITLATYPGGMGSFTSKKAAMYDMLTFVMADLAKDPDVDFFPFPSISPDVVPGSAQMYWGDPLNGFAVSANSKNIEAAVKTAEFFATQDSIYFTTVSKSKCGLDAGAELTDVPALAAKSIQTYEASATKIPALYSNLSAKMSAKWGPEWSKALTGNYTADEFVKALETEWATNFED